MLKPTLLVLVLAALASATPIINTTPLPAAGSGWFSYSWMDGGSAHVAFYGYDGAESVSVVCDSELLGSMCRYDGGAVIDGQSFKPGFFAVAVTGDVFDSVTGFDAEYQPVITQALNAALTVTSGQCPQQGSRDCFETFSIADPPLGGQVPEPSTWQLVIVGVGVFVIGFLEWDRRRKL